MASDYKNFGYAMMLMGDFNAEPNTNEMQALTKTDGLNLTDTAKDLGITFHNYGDKSVYCKIDYLLISDELICNKSYLWDDSFNGIYLSDHYPISSDIQLNK